MSLSSDPAVFVLSICIATYNRARYIAATLEAILTDLPERVEVVIVDGASPDGTSDVVAPFVQTNKKIRYFRETSNSGVDRDFDKAVGYASGEYCWLMSDDDILAPGTVARVVALLRPPLDLLVVNAQIRNADLTNVLQRRILPITEDKDYDVAASEQFFKETGDYLSYIGCVVIKRTRWLEREREAYMGSLFIHVGVIFQSPLQHVKVIADPLISIRYGNAMWTNRGFEIWMFKWPDLIWSFDDFSASAKRVVVSRQPWREWRRLLLFRANNAYSFADYVKFFRAEGRGGMLQCLTAKFPAGWANAATAIYWFFANRSARAGIYDLARSSSSRPLTRLIARRLKIPIH